MHVLVIAPHADDEVLGCGGLIRRRLDEGHSATVVVASIGTVHRAGELKASADTRRDELTEAARRLGIEPPAILFEGYENQLDTLPMLKFVSALDELLTDRPYDQVFIPYPSHHQDHRIVYEACFTALREKGGAHAPSLIAAYEYPYIGWTPTEPRGGKFYLDITSYLDQKLHALAAYESQLGQAPHPTSPEAVTTLAAMRGLDCGRAYAELFYMLKMVQ